MARCRRPEKHVRIVGGEVALVRPERPHILQAQPGDELVAVADRLLEQVARVDEDDGRRGVDARHHVQQHGGIRAEARHKRDAPRKLVEHRLADACLGGRMLEVQGGAGHVGHVTGERSRIKHSRTALP